MTGYLDFYFVRSAPKLQSEIWPTSRSRGSALETAQVISIAGIDNHSTCSQYYSACVIKGMTREELETHIKEGKSALEIAETRKMGYSTVRYWLRKYGLKTKWRGYLNGKFSDDELVSLWDKSTCFTHFLTLVGVQASGGAWYHYRNRLTRLGIKVDEKTGNWRQKGGLTSGRLRNAQAIKRKGRIRRHVLKKFLDLNFVAYKCNRCSLEKWQNKRIKLDIHHRDGDKENNVIENLEYLCPNCHAVEHYIEN